MREFRETLGSIFIITAMFAFLTELIIAVPSGPGQPANVLALVIYATGAVLGLGIVMYKDND